MNFTIVDGLAVPDENAPSTIALVEWRAPSLLDGKSQGDPEHDSKALVEYVSQLCEHYRSVTPQIDCYHYDKPDAVGYLDCLAQAIVKATDDLSLICLLAHGLPNGLVWHPERDVIIPYSELGSTLEQSLAKIGVSRLDVCFGSCHALSSDSVLLESMPKRVYRVTGYSGSPLTSTAIRLMAATITEFSTGYSALKWVLNESALVDGSSELSANLEAFATYFDQPITDPTRELPPFNRTPIVDDEEGTVYRATRTGGAWDINALPVR
jgi:hypothetical protein